MEQMIPLQHSLEEAMFEPARGSSHVMKPTGNGGMDAKRFGDDAVSTPATPSRDETIETRSMRSESSASRNPNRLSLTLPIAPPTPNPSRPTPAASYSSIPPTPTDTPLLMSPVDPGDFITAIAAQERRVMELKEELNQAELELRRLKKQFSRDESRRKLQAQRTAPLRIGPPVSDTDGETGTRQNVDLDRKRALLLGQALQLGPERSRRRVFTGSHARTLSLLSPTKAPDGFAVLEDGSAEPKSARELADSPYMRESTPITPAQLAKRASWAPRSAHQQASAMKQIADDLKSGLWTFVEDLRQVAIGDEPITGQGRYIRGADGSMRDTNAHDDGSGDNQETIRASATQRPRAAAAFDGTPTPGSRFVDVEGDEAVKGPRGLTRSNTESAITNKAKRHYSWTPLTVNDDDDWSSWESPNQPSTDRWSGSTIVDGNLIATIPEKNDENDVTSAKKGATSRLRSRSPASGKTAKLEELLPPVLNSLSPSNLKKHASEFMKEWEKSLAPPEPAAPAS